MKIWEFRLEEKRIKGIWDFEALQKTFCACVNNIEISVRGDWDHPNSLHGTTEEIVNDYLKVQAFPAEVYSHHRDR